MYKTLINSPINVIFQGSFNYTLHFKQNKCLGFVTLAQRKYSHFEKKIDISKQHRKMNTKLQRFLVYSALNPIRGAKNGVGAMLQLQSHKIIKESRMRYWTSSLSGDIRRIFHTTDGYKSNHIYPDGQPENLGENSGDISSIVFKNTVSKQNRQFLSNKPIDSQTSLKFMSTIPESRSMEIEYKADLGMHEYVQSLFPFPKNQFHNIFQMVVHELKRNDLKLACVYQMIQEPELQWKCTYHLKWPQNIKFSAVGKTKVDASAKASIAALSWLLSNKAIDERGMPRLVDEHDARRMLINSVPQLKLPEQIVERMTAIRDLHDTEFAPRFEENASDETNSDVSALESDTEISDNVQKRFNWDRYLTNEEVKLPISDSKEKFISLLRENRVVILKGDPGCGKSTRIPQYILEAWAQEADDEKPCKIAVTQPRRIAAVSLAKRVASERYEIVSPVVGYQVKMVSKFNEDTGRILYCTTGILLNRMKSDPNLTSFTHVVLDEVHERSLDMDLLMTLLRNALTNNPDLKIIVMSATINTNIFQQYFNGAPVLEVEGFTYPVKQYFLDDCDLDLKLTQQMCGSSSPSVIHKDVVTLLNYIHRNKEEGAILVFLPGWDDLVRVKSLIPDDNTLVVHLLHSKMQEEEQNKIFSKPPPGIRKIILSTNIAEASITIDDISYVVDTGISKEVRFHYGKGISYLDNYWISRASANQRKGRAGRCQSGECFHLYPKSKYLMMDSYTMPEIMRKSLTKIVLDCKLFTDNMNSEEFMKLMPSPPSSEAVLNAVKKLKDMNLLDSSEILTPLGRTVAKFPLDPKLSKAIVNSVIYKCVTPVLDIITMFSTETNIFAFGFDDKETVRVLKKKFCDNSDHLAMMELFDQWMSIDDPLEREIFCNKNNLIYHKLTMVEKLWKYYYEYLDEFHDLLKSSDDYFDNEELIKGVLYSGVGTLLKYRNFDITKTTFKNVDVFYNKREQKIKISSESVNYKRKEYPSNFLIHLYESSSNIRRATFTGETSLMSNLAVVLFTNEEIDLKNADFEDSSSDKVILYFKNTNIEFLCLRSEAEIMIQCKKAIDAIYEYYMNELLTTDAGYRNTEVSECWNKVLDNLNEILLLDKVK